jgi:hypothetical protein
MRDGTKSICASFAVLVIGTSVAAAQTAAPSTAAAASSAQRPPVARQIEPMVAPVRRITPKIVPPSIQAAQLPAATGAARAAKPQGVAQLQPAARAHAQPSSSPAPKIVVHTCKLGQDYSEKLKACFTPGVAKASNAAKAIRGKIAAAVEAGTRSSLGAKRKN